MTNQTNAAQARQYHILKTDPEVFQAVLSGAKTFEIRLNDRGYAVGDVLGLRETKHTGAEMQAGAPLEYTGRECQRFVSHVLTGYGLADGWCCLSFDLPNAGGASAPVAGEAQAAIGYLNRNNGRTDWSMARAAYDLPDGIHMLYAAPQASEAMRDAAWCCERGQAQGVQVCQECAEASAAYSAAMAPVRTEGDMGSGQLPPIPLPAHRGPSGTGSYFDSFTAAQMHAYVLADRQQRAGRPFPAHPLGVFSAGKWTYDGTGEAFSHTDLDEAAFVVYRAALSAQPGAQKEKNDAS